MIYPFSLSSVAITVGLLYLVFHVWAAVKPKQFAVLAKQFPRHLIMGKVLMALATVWIVWLCTTMDLGEFSSMRQGITLFFGALGVLSFWLLKDYLAVRGLAILLLLGANVLLDGAFLSDNPIKFIIPALAYLWIICGITLICSPYLLRDGLAWTTAKESRLQMLAWPGAIFGGILVLLGVLVY